jgi:hypothetical protein
VLILDRYDKMVAELDAVVSKLSKSSAAHDIQHQNTHSGGAVGAGSSNSRAVSRRPSFNDKSVAFDNADDDMISPADMEQAQLEMDQSSLMGRRRGQVKTNNNNNNINSNINSDSNNNNSITSKLQDELASVKADLQRERSRIESLSTTLTAVSGERELMRAKAMNAATALKMAEDSVSMKETMLLEEKAMAENQIRRLIAMVTTKHECVFVGVCVCVCACAHTCVSVCWVDASVSY